MIVMCEYYNNMIVMCEYGNKMITTILYYHQNTFWFTISFAFIAVKTTQSREANCILVWLSCKVTGCVTVQLIYKVTTCDIMTFDVRQPFSKIRAKMYMFAVNRTFYGKAQHDNTESWQVHSEYDFYTFWQ